MHRFRSAFPRRELRQFVRAYAERDFFQPAQALVETQLAQLDQVLNFEFEDRPVIEYRDGRAVRQSQTAVMGYHTYPRADLRLSGRIKSFGVFLQPFALWQLFGLPL